jgi:hypothetical protein
VRLTSDYFETVTLDSPATDRERTFLTRMGFTPITLSRWVRPSSGEGCFDSNGIWQLHRITGPAFARSRGYADGFPADGELGAEYRE